MEHPSHQHKSLTLANIQEIENGKAALAVNQALQAITRDILDRPGDKTARKVVFTIEMKPELCPDTKALDTIGNEFTVETKVPKRRTKSYPMLPGRDGVQFFQPSSPFDPRQRTFSFPGGEQTEAQQADDADATFDDDPE